MSKLFTALLILMLTNFSYAENGEFELTSQAFTNGGNIPAKYSFKKQNISPEIKWAGAPQDTKSYILIMVDPDAKQVVGHPVIHWVVYNIPANISILKENNQHFDKGLNSYSKTEYSGMNPPAGQKHNYHFYLYALSAEKLVFLKAPTAAELLDEAKKSLLGHASLIAEFAQ